MLNDENLTRMIRDAHQATLRVPLSSITGRKRVRRLNFAVAVPAGAAVIAALAVGAFGVFGGAPTGTRPDLMATEPTGKPPRPSSAAETAHGRCVDYADNELFDRGMDALPPLRFHTVVVEGQLELLMYADDNGDVACWLTPDFGVVSVGSSDLTTAVRPLHPAGKLTNSSSAYGRDPIAAYSFGRVPAGTTRVEIKFPDGSAVAAQLKDGWYLYTATASAAERLSEVTAIEATVNGTKQTLSITHG